MLVLSRVVSPPMPPAPRSATTSYGPRRVPGESVMKVDEILSVGGLSHRPPVLRVLEFRERHRQVG
jgi:hypothetical protein